VTRLRDEMGDRTIAIDAFEGNNLVLVDEGHRGATGGEEGAWMRFRDALCEQGFSFEWICIWSLACSRSSSSSGSTVSEVRISGRSTWNTPCGSSLAVA
jgi:hypothetical protein